MAWTTPKTWANLDPLIASEFNTQFRDNLNDLDSRVDSINGKLGRSYDHPLLHRAVIGINQNVSITSTSLVVWHTSCKLTFTPKTNLVLFGVQYSFSSDAGSDTRRTATFGLRKGSSDVSLDTTDVVGTTLASFSDLAIRSIKGGDANLVEYQIPVSVSRDTEVSIFPTAKIGSSNTLTLRNPSVMILTALDVGAYE